MPVKVETSIKEEKVPLGAAVAIKREASPSVSDEDGAEEDEEESNWWELENLRIASKGEKRWDTLSHNGVQFPPLYVPHGIPIRYEGKEFRMTPDEEEVATMFAVLKESEYYKNPLFRTNFFRSWRAILDKRAEPHPIRRLELCDFEAIYQWHVREREKRLSRSREEKKEAQRLANEEAEPYKTCLWNGKQEQVANFRVEPPGLFRGRGKHPLAGKLKKRLQAEDITINIGKEAEVPAPPPGHHWAAVQHDNTVTWLAMWRDNVAGNFKYVMLAPSSSVKGQSDMMKFERARKLKTVVDDIRASYTEDFRSSSKQVAQRAVAMYFIDKLALRVGNEKGSDEADTVGCCSLRVEHIKLLPHNGVRFDFLGKDSIRYQNEVTVLPEVHALLQKFTHGRRPDSDIFNELTTTQLNDHLKSFMDGLTAKVFRTYNASITLDRWFKEKPVDAKMSVADKLAYFNKANTEVAVLCNHQKAVSKNHHSQMAVLGTKSTYTRQIIEQLERAMETIQKKSLKAAVDEFFAEQDRIQLEWLKAYGTDEQREDYETIRKNRGMPKQKSASTRKSSTSGEKKKRSSSSRKTATKKKTSAKKTSSKRSKTPTKKAGSKRGSKKEESDEDDVPLHQLAKAGAAKKTTPKKPAAKRPRVKAEDSDDDDVPLANLLA